MAQCRRALRVSLAVPVLALTLAACGHHDESAAEPTPVAALNGANPVVAVGSQGVKPFVEPPCPAPRRFADRSDPAVTRAADQIRTLGEKHYASGYAGLIPCVTTGRIVVYRLPSTRPSFAPKVAAIAKQRHVDVSFSDALFSFKQAQATKKAVLGAFARLDDAGAPFAVLNVRENGTVEVAVRSNVPAAEQVLHDLLDRIYVVLIPEELPSPTP
jgi:hypothetical protein